MGIHCCDGSDADVAACNKARAKTAACCDDNADGDNGGNDGADAAGINMMLTFLVLVMLIVMVMRMLMGEASFRAAPLDLRTLVAAAGSDGRRQRNIARNLDDDGDGGADDGDDDGAGDAVFAILRN